MVLVTLLIASLCLLWYKVQSSLSQLQNTRFLSILREEKGCEVVAKSPKYFDAGFSSLQLPPLYSPTPSDYLLEQTKVLSRSKFDELTVLRV